MYAFNKRVVIKFQDVGKMLVTRSQAGFDHPEYSEFEDFVDCDLTGIAVL